MKSQGYLGHVSLSTYAGKTYVVLGSERNIPGSNIYFTSISGSVVRGTASPADITTATH